MAMVPPAHKIGPQEMVTKHVQADAAESLVERSLDHAVDTTDGRTRVGDVLY